MNKRIDDVSPFSILLSMEICQLDKPLFYQCCCVCKYQKQVVTNVGKHSIGHVCILYHDMDESNDKVIWQSNGPHSVGCEMFTDKREQNGLPSEIGKNT